MMADDKAALVPDGESVSVPHGNRAGVVAWGKFDTQDRKLQVGILRIQMGLDFSAYFLPLCIGHLGATGKIGAQQEHKKKTEQVHSQRVSFINAGFNSRVTSACAAIR